MLGFSREPGMLPRELPLRPCRLYAQDSITWIGGGTIGFHSLQLAAACIAGRRRRCVEPASPFGGNQPMLEGERREGGGIVKVELAHEVGTVFFDGFHADVQEVGNFLVLVALPQQL